MTRQFQRGFTLAEVVVGVLILTVAMTALLGAAGHTARLLGDGARFTRAGLAAAAEMERLVAMPCGATVQGDTVIGDVTVRRIRSPGPPTVEIRVDVDFVAAGRLRQDSLRTSSWCR